MPIMYGMVAGRDHGCEKQPLTDAQKEEREKFKGMRRDESAEIDAVLTDIFEKEGTVG